MAEHGAREWCVSLEMAQRPELAAAMQAAGMGSSWLDWELAPDDEGWQIAAVRAAVQDEITKIAIQSFRGYGLDQLDARLRLDLQHLDKHAEAEAKYTPKKSLAILRARTDELAALLGVK